MAASANSSFINLQYPTMTTSTPPAIETLATMVRRDTPEVLLTDSRPAPSPTSFNPSVLTQGSWTTKISGLPTAIAPPSSTSSSVTSGTDTGSSLNHGTSISLILLLSLSVAVIIWVLSYVLINRRRRAGKSRLSVPRLCPWPSFSLFALSRKWKGRAHFRTKRSDSRTSLLPSDRLAGAKLDHREMPPGNGHRVGGQTAVATWTHPPPVELDGQGIGDPPIQPDWVSRMSSFLATGRGGKGHHRRMDSSLRETRSIRESFGEKINDPGVAVLIREPRKTLSRYSRAISEKALPEIPESEETVPTASILASPRRHWEKTASRNTFGSLKGGWASARSLPLQDTRRIDEESVFTEVRTAGNQVTF